MLLLLPLVTRVLQSNVLLAGQSIFCLSISGAVPMAAGSLYTSMSLCRWLHPTFLPV